MKKLLLTLLALLISISCVSMNVLAEEDDISDETIEETADLVASAKQFNAVDYVNLGYAPADFYRNWSQDMLPWGAQKLSNSDAEFGTFNYYGCGLVAFAKIAVQSGAYSQSEMNPDVIRNLFNNAGLMNSGGFRYSLQGSLSNAQKYGDLIGMEAVQIITSNIANEVYNAIMADPSGNTQFIFALSGHYVCADISRTVAKQDGEVYILDSYSYGKNDVNATQPNHNDLLNVYETRYVDANGYLNDSILKEGKLSRYSTIYAAIGYRVKNTLINASFGDVDKFELGKVYAINVVKTGNLATKFTTSNNRVAEVDSEGNVKITGFGDAVITVQYGNNSKTVEVGCHEIPLTISQDSNDMKNLRVSFSAGRSPWKFELFRAEDPAFTVNGKSQVLVVNQHLDSVKQGVTYYYFMVAWNDDGEEVARSNKMAFANLPKVTGLSVTTSDDDCSQTLKWQAAVGAKGDGNGYEILASDNGGEYRSLARLENPAKLEYIATDRVPGHDYSYKVRVYQYRNYKNTTVTYEDRPEMMEAFIAGPSCTEVKKTQGLGKTKITRALALSLGHVSIDFTEVKGADGYMVYRKAPGEKTFAYIGTQSVNHYDDYTALKYDTNYYYKVVPYKDLGTTSIKGGESNVATVPITMVSPKLSYCFLSDTKVEIALGELGLADRYEISRSTVSATKGFGDPIETTDTSIVEDVNYGVTYFYRVRCLGSDGFNVGRSTSYSTLKVTVPYPELQDVNAYRLNSNAAYVEWKEAKDSADTHCIGYAIYRSPSLLKGGTKIAEVQPNVLNYVDSSAKAGFYFYSVAPIYQVPGMIKPQYGNKKAHIFPVGIVPDKVEGVIAEPFGFNGVTVTWNETDADGYIIYRRLSGGDFTGLATVKGGATTRYIDSKTLEGAYYDYKVVAYKSNSKFAGEHSEIVSVKAGCDVVEMGLMNAIAVNDGKIEVSWDAVPGAVSYDITRIGVSGLRVTTTVKKNKFTDTYGPKYVDYSDELVYTVVANSASGRKSLANSVSTNKVAAPTSITFKKKLYDDVYILNIKAPSSKAFFRGYYLYVSTNPNDLLNRDIEDYDDISVNCGVGFTLIGDYEPGTYYIAARRCVYNNFMTDDEYYEEAYSSLSKVFKIIIK